MPRRRPASTSRMAASVRSLTGLTAASCIDISPHPVHAAPSFPHPMM